MANRIVPAALTGLHPPAPQATVQAQHTTRTLRVERALTVEESTSISGLTGFEHGAVVPHVANRQAIEPATERVVAVSAVRVWSLVFAWWWSLLMAPLFAVLAVIGLIHPPVAHLIVVGAIAVSIGASIVALTLVDDALRRHRPVSRPTAGTCSCVPLSAAEDGAPGRPEAVHSGLMSENTLPITPLANSQPVAARPNARPLVPRKSQESAELSQVTAGHQK